MRPVRSRSPPRRHAARFRDLGPGYYGDKISAGPKIRNHVGQLEALGMTVTITAAEDAA
jgi:hypothetical protein